VSTRLPNFENSKFGGPTLAKKKTRGSPNVVDVLKPVFGKKDPLSVGMRALKKEVKDFPERESAVLAAWKNDKTSAIDFGKALLRLKEAFYTHGFFTKWLRANDVDQNRASYCMRKALNKVEESQKKRNVYLNTIIKKEVDDLFRTAARKTESMEQISTRITKITRDLCFGVGRAASWQRKTGKAQAFGEALMKSLDAYLDALYVTYELDENGGIVDRATGRVFPDVGSAVAAQEAAAAASAGS
jgi:hypothetical protein